jgi:EAL domain-containing protein (putative c-di-GMP-specific phosphodiesterase class I)
VLEKLSALGIAIALDDFGTGYAGLDYLKTLPISCLKIDKTFVQEMATSLRSYEIVQSAINLACSLGLSTIAEGIEDEDTVRRLNDLGCNIAQGYYFARPMPASAVAAWLKQVQADGSSAHLSRAGWRCHVESLHDPDRSRFSLSLASWCNVRAF